MVYFVFVFILFLCEPSGEFDNFCRMTPADFEFLLNKISPVISKQDTHFREAIPAKYRLAITLDFLHLAIVIKVFIIYLKYLAKAYLKSTPERKKDWSLTN